MRLERLQQDNEMITQHDVFWITLTLKKNCQLITADLSKQKAFQQIVFTSTMKTK